MSEQEENEKICEWLGWKKLPREEGALQRWNDQKMVGTLWPETPTFRTGNDMLMILGAMPESMGVEVARVDGPSGRWACSFGVQTRFGETAPDAVRAAVLAIIGESKNG